MPFLSFHPLYPFQSYDNLSPFSDYILYLLSTLLYAAYSVAVSASDAEYFAEICRDLAQSLQSEAGRTACEAQDEVGHKLILTAYYVVHVMSYHIILYHIMSNCDILYHTISCHVVLCQLHIITPYHSSSYHIISHYSYPYYYLPPDYSNLLTSTIFVDCRCFKFAINYT